MIDYRGKNKEKIKGVKIEAFNIGMIIASAIVFIILIHIISCTSLKYRQFVAQTEAYVSCEQTAVMLREDSDYLTAQAQQFVQSADISYMQAYLKKLNEHRSRRNITNYIEVNNGDEHTAAELEKVLADFDESVEREIYAMRLASETGISDSKIIPRKVLNVPLKEEDAALDKAAMLEKAKVMLIDMNYQELKTRVNTGLDNVLGIVLNNMKSRQDANIKALNKINLNLYVFIGILFVLTIVIYTASTILIVRPLKKGIQRIKEHDTLEIVGSREIKYLALTYNEIYEMNAANEAMLIHKAEHDPLTGVLNRGAFDDLRAKLHTTTESVTLILLDVDRFKYINDSSGHEMGDKILQKVANLLMLTFSAKDFVIRLGGDEFAVVILGDTKGRIEILEKRIDKINTLLINPQDGLPPVSLSAGAACSKSGFSDKLYRQADQALYYVKEHGRNGLSFY